MRTRRRRTFLQLEQLVLLLIWQCAGLWVVAVSAILKAWLVSLAVQLSERQDGNACGMLQSEEEEPQPEPELEEDFARDYWM